VRRVLSLFLNERIEERPSYSALGQYQCFVEAMPGHVAQAKLREKIGGSKAARRVSAAVAFLRALTEIAS